MYLIYILLITAQWACSTTAFNISMASPTASNVQAAQSNHQHEDRSSNDTPTREADQTNPVVVRQEPNQLKSYIVSPKDYENDTQTKEVESFLRTQSKEADKITVWKLPGTSHTVGWGSVMLDTNGQKNVS
jgi:hypothetical protein